MKNSNDVLYICVIVFSVLGSSYAGQPRERGDYEDPRLRNNKVYKIESAKIKSKVFGPARVVLQPSNRPTGFIMFNVDDDEILGGILVIRTASCDRDEVAMEDPESGDATIHFSNEADAGHFVSRLQPHISEYDENLQFLRELDYIHRYK